MKNLEKTFITLVLFLAVSTALLFSFFIVKENIIGYYSAHISSLIIDNYRTLELKSYDSILLNPYSNTSSLITFSPTPTSTSTPFVSPSPSVSTSSVASLALSPSPIEIQKTETSAVSPQASPVVSVEKTDISVNALKTEIVQKQTSLISSVSVASSESESFESNSRLCRLIFSFCSKKLLILSTESSITLTI